MLSYFLNCKKDIEIVNPRVSKKKAFMEEQSFYQKRQCVTVKIKNYQASGSINKLGIKTFFRKMLKDVIEMLVLGVLML